MQVINDRIVTERANETIGLLLRIGLFMVVRGINLSPCRLVKIALTQPDSLCSGAAIKIPRAFWLESGFYRLNSPHRNTHY